MIASQSVTLCTVSTATIHVRARPQSVDQPPSTVFPRDTNKKNDVLSYICADIQSGIRDVSNIILYLQSALTDVPPVSSANPSPLPVLVHGKPAGADEERASEILGGDEFAFVMNLGGLEKPSAA